MRLKKSQASKGLIAKIAQQAAEQYIKGIEQPAMPYPLPWELAQQRACYVTIMENPGRHVRATYGRPLPRQATLAHEVAANTIEAVRTCGFLRPVDLSYFSYRIAVLGPLERISSLAHLDPYLYGLYIRSDRDKTGVILPRRTGVDTPDEQLATILRESGIRTNDESITMYRFFVKYYE